MSMLPLTVQFLASIVAYAINDRMSMQGLWLE
jgi:hypothetical protein